jgi:hypothetical protein
MNMEIESSRIQVYVLIQEIRDQATLFLQSALYPDVRQYYERLHAKLGKYYFKEGNLEKAREHYIEADKYSHLGYMEQIAACQGKKQETVKSEPDRQKIEKQKPIQPKPKIKPQSKPPAPKKQLLFNRQTTTLYYNKITSLWKTVRTIDDEKKAVVIVKKNISLKTRKNKAYMKLKAVKKKWIDYFPRDLQASAKLMLSQLYARTDNPGNQSRVLENLLTHLGINNLEDITLPDNTSVNKKQVEHTLKNVNRFLSLKECYIKPAESKTSKISRLVETIAFNELTPAQQIKARYMSGILLSQRNIYPSACYNLYKVIKLMDQYDITKVDIIWGTHYASRFPTIGVLSDNFDRLRKKRNSRTAFKKAYGEDCYSEIARWRKDYIRKTGKGIDYWIILLIALILLIILLIVIKTRK